MLTILQDPWATKKEDGADVRLYPHFPLPKPSTVLSDINENQNSRERTDKTERELERILEQSCHARAAARRFELGCLLLLCVCSASILEYERDRQPRLASGHGS
jgi:hypothetical protein